VIDDRSRVAHAEIHLDDKAETASDTTLEALRDALALVGDRGPKAAVLRLRLLAARAHRPTKATPR
jgi:hypothetical protein